MGDNRSGAQMEQFLIRHALMMASRAGGVNQSLRLYPARRAGQVSRYGPLHAAISTMLLSAMILQILMDRLHMRWTEHSRLSGKTSVVRYRPIRDVVPYSKRRDALGPSVLSTVHDYGRLAAAFTS
jgi:hypothetical protein